MKTKTEFSLSSAAETVALTTALGSGNEDDGLSEMSLVENLALAGGYLSFICYLNPRPPSYSAGRHSDALDIIQLHRCCFISHESRCVLEACAAPRGNWWEHMAPRHQPRLRAPTYRWQLLYTRLATMEAAWNGIHMDLARGSVTNYINRTITVLDSLFSIVVRWPAAEEDSHLQNKTPCQNYLRTAVIRRLTIQKSIFPQAFAASTMRSMLYRGR